MTSSPNHSSLRACLRAPSPASCRLCAALEARRHEHARLLTTPAPTMAEATGLGVRDGFADVLDRAGRGAVERLAPALRELSRPLTMPEEHAAPERLSLPTRPSLAQAIATPAKRPAWLDARVRAEIHAVRDSARRTRRLRIAAAAVALLTLAPVAWIGLSGISAESSQTPENKGTPPLAGAVFIDVSRMPAPLYTERSIIRGDS